MVEVREVKTRKEIKEFINFPLELYKDCELYVPVLYVDELKIFMDGILKDNNIYEQNEVDDAVMDNNNMEQNFQNEENGDIEGEEGRNEEDDND